jgi:hypothetical protein
MQASTFDVWRDWTNDILNTTRSQIEDATIRLRAMGGASTNFAIIYVKAGGQSGVVTAMENASGTYISPNIDGLVTFIESLPEPARDKIITALKASKQPQAWRRNE